MSGRGTNGGSERGSIVIAMAIVLVLTGLSAAALARTVSAVGSARVAQDLAAAAAVADAGVADATFTLDHTSIPPAGPTASGNGPAQGSAGSGRFAWTATATDAATVTVRSVGTVNARQHQTDATLTRAAQYPWVIATRGSLVLDGGSNVSGRVASAGPIVLRNGAIGGDAQDLAGPGAACAGCPAATVLPGPVTFPTSAPPSGTSPLPCPTSPISALAPGTYLCPVDISFGPDVDLVGPVVIYQTNGQDGLAAPTAVRFAGSSVNRGGVAGQLIIHKMGPGLIDPGDDNAAGSFTGIIDAPQATLRSAGCRFRLDGAMVLGSLLCVATRGGPTFTYDAGSIPGGAWAVVLQHDAAVGGS